MDQQTLCVWRCTADLAKGERSYVSIIRAFSVRLGLNPQQQFVVLKLVDCMNTPAQARALALVVADRIGQEAKCLKLLSFVFILFEAESPWILECARAGPHL